MAENLLTFKPPILDFSIERYAAFESWKSKWDDYVNSNLTAKENEYKCAMLRYSFSNETQKIQEMLNLSEEDKKDISWIIVGLQTIAKVVVNEMLERHIFNAWKQEEGEVFDGFLTNLKILATIVITVWIVSMVYCMIALL